MRFTKMQGAGNDFVMLDATQEPFTLTTEQIRALCDRRYGVGCDQLLVVEKSALPEVDFKYRIFNCSGGEVEMCGNGARCFAVFVRELGLTDKTTIACETVKGVIRPHMEDDGTVTVDMGRPRFEAADVGLVTQGLETKTEGEATLYKIAASGLDNWVSIVSMGNPHAVMFIDEHPKDFDLEKYGKACEGNTNVFPDRVNAEFAKIIDRNNIEMRVYERGSGETLACGTGSCATAVAAITLGLCDNDVTIHLLGGDLDISWSGDVNDSVFMTGPAKEVFTGEVDLNKFD